MRSIPRLPGIEKFEHGGGVWAGTAATKDTAAVALISYGRYIVLGYSVHVVFFTSMMVDNTPIPVNSTPGLVNTTPLPL